MRFAFSRQWRAVRVLEAIGPIWVCHCLEVPDGPTLGGQPEVVVLVVSEVLALAPAVSGLKNMIRQPGSTPEAG